MRHDAGVSRVFTQAKIADVYSIAFRDVAEQEANARLFAAAPALYEALEALCDSLRRREGSKLINVNHDELMDMIPKARAALSAALPE